MEKIINCANGHYHTITLTEKGEVFGWGWNGNGQLAEQVKIQQYTYHRLDRLPRNIIGISAGALTPWH